MEPDFVTRQHLDSLANGDKSFAEILNRYGSAPQPQSPPPGYHGQFYGMPPQFHGNGGDAILLSNMLGQIQAGIQRTPDNKGYEGFQLNINSDVLKWVGLLLLVLVLVWLFLKVNKGKKNPLGKKIDRLHNELQTLKDYKSLSSSPQKKVNFDDEIIIEDPDLDIEDLDIEDLDDEDLDFFE